MYSLNVHRTRRVCVRRGGASRRSVRSEEATSTSRFRAWNCLASIYRGTEREGTVGPEGVAAADGRGGYGPWCAQMMDGSLRPCNPRPFLAHLYTFAHWPNHPTLPTTLFFFFSTFVTNLLFLSFSIFLSLSLFFWSFHICLFLPSGLFMRVRGRILSSSKFSFQTRLFCSLLLIGVCVGVRVYWACF